MSAEQAEQQQTEQPDQLRKYLAENETVDEVARGETRTFVVTDRRVMNIQEGTSREGKPTETVQSTLFSDIAGVDVSIQESITQTQSGRRILAVLIALVGIGVFAASTQLSGSLRGPLVILGLIAILVGVILWVNATETSPGGITIRLQHTTPDDTVIDQYVLPENQQDAARAVLRQVGNAHEP